jgi:hypothetical protein
MKRAALAALLWLAAGAAGAQEPAPDVPPGPARITGRVLRAEDRSPVAGAEVALYALTAEGVPGLRRAESDAEGRFVFENVANDPAVGWLVGARFRGVAFPGGRVAFEAGKTEAAVEVMVDEPTADPGAISVSELRLRLVREPAGLRAVETLTLENRGRNTYYAAPEARAAAQPALTTSLPPGAGSFEMPLGVVPEGLVSESGRLSWYGPVYPGTQELSWSYVLPPLAGAAEGDAPTRFAFEARVPERTGRLVVLLSDASAQLEARGLSGPEDVEVERRRVQRFTREAPEAGTLALAVSLPPARVAPDAVSVSEVRAVLRLDDAALDVTETHVLRVAGDAHVLGTPAAPLLRIPLPEGAERLRFGSDAPGLELAPHPQGGLAALGAVAPGEVNVELGYQLAVTEPPAKLERRFAARVPVLSIFVADTGRLAPRSERLHRRRPLRTSDLTYLHLEAFEVAPEEAVALELGLLPARTRSGRPLALGFVGIAALAAIWLLTSPLRTRKEGEVAARGPSAEPGAREEREAIYEAIRDLDHDFETGKLSTGDHTRLRDELRARALVLLEAERRASQAPPAPAAGACSACGAPALPTHRFCAQCGKLLSATSEARGEAKPSEVTRAGV